VPAVYVVFVSVLVVCATHDKSPLPSVFRTWLADPSAAGNLNIVLPELSS